MEIKYIVNGVEFSDFEEAKSYEESLTLKKAKFEEGQKVYFWDTNVGCLVEATIKEIKYISVNNKPRILYTFTNWANDKYESALFGSYKEFHKHILQKAREDK